MSGMPSPTITLGWFSWWAAIRGWLLPYALLLMARGGFGLPRPWAEAAIAGQALPYGLAAVD